MMVGSPQQGRLPAKFPRPDRLLEGERPRTVFPQDARHWIAVYREMIEFKDELLTRMRTQLMHLPAAARQDVVDNDIAMLEDQLRRYHRRLEFWYARQWQLEGFHIDDVARTVTSHVWTVVTSRRGIQLLTRIVT